MPECAECKILVDQLNENFAGQDILNVEVVGGRFAHEGLPGLTGLQLPLMNTQFHNKGKFIYWTFDQNKAFFITLGMTGGFGPKEKHSAIKFTFSKTDIYFNDPRHFGTVKLDKNKSDLKDKLLTFGWDPLQENLDMAKLLPRFRKNNHKSIAEVLLDQSVIAGNGNYLRAEELYLSQINPFRLVQSLSDQELTTICQNVIVAVHGAYSKGGATLATYTDMHGNRGTYSKEFLVYRKKSDPYGNPVTSTKAPDGRTIHYVKSVQL